jgi:hypothetical protein
VSDRYGRHPLLLAALSLYALAILQLRRRAIWLATRGIRAPR